MRQLRISLTPEGQLALHIPSPLGAGYGHTVEVPITEDGLRIIRDTLRAYDSGEETRIGGRASPTQADVQALLRAFKPKPTTVLKPKVAPDLDFDITDEDLGIF